MSFHDRLTLRASKAAVPIVRWEDDVGASAQRAHCNRYVVLGCGAAAPALGRAIAEKCDDATGSAETSQLRAQVCVARRGRQHTVGEQRRIDTGVSHVEPGRPSTEAEQGI